MYCLLNLHSAYAIKIYFSIPDQHWSSIYEELKSFHDGGCRSDQVQYTNFKAQ